MQRIVASPWASLGVGLLIAAVLLVVWLILSGGADVLGFVSFLLRFLHVLAAMVWVGLIFFVNFVQLAALQEADDAARGFLGRSVIPQVASWFRHAGSLTVASGLLLAIPAGYLFSGLIYGAGVYVPAQRALLLWLGALGGLVMLAFVHMYIWPSLQVVLGLRPGDAEAKAQARQRVATFARLNLILAVPVTFAMVAAAHLY